MKTEIRCEVKGMHLRGKRGQKAQWVDIFETDNAGAEACISVPQSQLPNVKIGDQIRLTIEVDAPGNLEES